MLETVQPEILLLAVLTFHVWCMRWEGGRLVFMWVREEGEWEQFKKIKSLQGAH